MISGSNRKLRYGNFVVYEVRFAVKFILPRVFPLGVPQELVSLRNERRPSRSRSPLIILRVRDDYLAGRRDVVERTRAEGRDGRAGGRAEVN